MATSSFNGVVDCGCLLTTRRVHPVCWAGGRLGGCLVPCASPGPAAALTWPATSGWPQSEQTIWACRVAPYEWPNAIGRPAPSSSLASTLFVPDPVVRGGETDTAGGVDLADHDLTNGGLVGAPPLRLGLAGQCFVFLAWPMPLGMGGDQNTSVTDGDETVSDRDVDRLNRQPNADRVQGRGEADLAGLADLAGC